jgi:hypothetical protein
MHFVVLEMAFLETKIGELIEKNEASTPALPPRGPEAP